MRVGAVVNPIAGMGGRVGLKGTDGKIEEARERGAEPRAPGRAAEALRSLRERVEDLELLTFAGVMGAAEARTAGLEPTVVGEPEGQAEDAVSAETTAADTAAAVRSFVEAGVDLILFVGGDGTAVDVTEQLEAHEADVPILGVPAGVKVYSSVFAVTPAAAGRVAATFSTTEEREVVDLDESAYRDGEVRTSLRGIVRVPVADALQSAKQLGGGTVEGIATGVADDVDPGVTYVLGPGSTVQAIKRELGFEGSPLGVDVWQDDEVLVEDGGEAAILAALGEENAIVVSPIGGQGFIFGRGNQQLSPAVIERSDVHVVASRRKLDTTGVLRVDTGDEALDEELRGWRKVRTGRFEHRLLQVV